MTTSNALGRAVRSGFWLAFGLINEGEQARDGAGITGAQRLLRRDESRLRGARLTDLAARATAHREGGALRVLACGWPLHVIEVCADDPARDRPEGFLKALRTAVGGTTRQDVAV